MPKAAADTPSPLATHHVFLDTEVYRELGHNPESPPLKTLEGRIAADDLILHTTDITFAEIRRQLREYVEETAVAMNAARKKLGRWKNRLPNEVRLDVPPFDAAVIAEAAYQTILDVATTKWKIIKHNATGTPALKVFQDYFERNPPFEKRGSKEFPDAFVIKVLAAWCKANDCKMYVVTKDGAMTDAVKATTVLLPMRSLTELLAAQAATETPDARNIAQTILDDPKVATQIAAEIGKNLQDLIPIYTGDEYADGEVIDHGPNGEPELEDFSVIAASKSEVSLILKMRVPLNIEIDFEDRSSAIYDREDGVYFGAEIAYAEIEDDPRVRVFLKVDRKKHKVSNFKMLTNEFEFSEPYEDFK